MTGCFDAHNHLQDERFGGHTEALLSMARQSGVQRMVVNGACESDWPDVARLARSHPMVLPSFGLHPWYVGERSPDWRDRLRSHLIECPESGLGEIGLDRWMLDNPDRWRCYRGADCAFAGEPATLAEQEDAFSTQLDLAVELNRPVSIHCLQAFGRLRELLGAKRMPHGFLLHSYGGPAEMIPEFTRLGGYFSFPGYFLHARKSRQRDVFRKVPFDRLLVETDAPDQLPPAEYAPHPCSRTDGRPLNHPANLPAIYAGLATVLDRPLGELQEQVACNFRRLFGEGCIGTQEGRRQIRLAS